MESISESDEIMVFTQLVPPKYKTNMAIRREEEKKGKAHTETSEPHQVGMKKKSKKHTYKRQLKKI